MQNQDGCERNKSRKIINSAINYQHGVTVGFLLYRHFFFVMLSL